MDDGYIKFQCEWISSESLPESKLISLKQIRDKLFKQGFLGERGGVGFGNISIREGTGFIITGSATGGAGQ